MTKHDHHDPQSRDSGGRGGNPTVLFGGALACLLALMAFHGWVYRWLCDDAYISFRYVRQWVRGEGLVFNPGEYVEGYTNFLWIVELAALWWATGLRPEHTAWWLSAIWTVVLIATLVWLGLRSSRHDDRQAVVLLSVLWMAVQPHVAIWTTSGLETRQFSALVVLGMAILTPPGRLSWQQAASGSILLGLASLTRPEGWLVFACAFAWVAFESLRQNDISPGRLLAAATPFLLIVGGHLLFRYAYYGEWLPNTYYAKHVRAWPEAGLNYVFGFGLETGMYAVIPLFLVGIWRRWIVQNDGFLWLGSGLILLHCGYVITIGGDHFIYRPFDLYFPIVFLGAAEGTVAVARWIAAGLPPNTRAIRFGVISVVAIGVAAYSSLIPLATTVVGSRIQEYARGIDPELTPRNAPYLYWLPMMAGSIEGVQRSRAYCIPRGIGIRWREHRLLWQDYIRFWEPYEAIADRGVIPLDAVGAYGTVGIMPYHLIDLTVIDTFGLTDRTVARNPVTRPNDERYMAHDRQVPFGYLEERGFNFSVAPAARSLEDALSRGQFAYRISDTLWMPFDSGYHDWVRRSFDRERLAERVTLDANIPNRNRTFFNNRFYTGRQFLGRFDGTTDGWFLQGDAMSDQPATGSRPTQLPVLYFAGSGVLNTYHPTQHDRAIGQATSAPFVPRPGDLLQFLLAGGSSESVGVRLRVNGTVVQKWHGKQGEVLGPVQADLSAYAGQPCTLEIYDEDSGPWGHVLADHFLLMTPE